MALRAGFGRLGMWSAGSSSMGSVDYTALGLRVGSCLLSGSSETKARCIFNALLAAAERTDRGTEMLRAVATGTCEQFLSAAGLNASLGGAVCFALSSFWATFQRWAQDELYAIEFEDYLSSIRVEKIPLRDGGGYRYTDPDGVVRRICPFRTRTAGWVMSELAPGQTCTQFQIQRQARTMVGMGQSLDTGPVVDMPVDARPKSSASTVAVVGGLGILGILAYVLLV